MHTVLVLLEGSNQEIVERGNGQRAAAEGRVLGKQSRDSRKIVCAGHAWKSGWLSLMKQSRDSRKESPDRLLADIRIKLVEAIKR